MNVVSESGMYALIFRSRKPEARRFRKWVTAEVLPELRRTGQYQMRDLSSPELGQDYDPNRINAAVAAAREARRLFGIKTARSVWVQLGLPVAIADARGDHSGDPLAAPLKAWLATVKDCTIEDAARALDIERLDHSTRYRIGALLRLFGWYPRKMRIDRFTTANVFSPASNDVEG